ncbi:hypothetical protein NITHO_7150001 [Nitrolancea hollandica Lb]|uniref:Uncharacterized protein n=1 Tax=Nitrolancea hollandica Lb TaxID=1129897 RepID=I4EN21_9BACT|nr:hypothetical protein NITHO_7150001 [Nitrolancea hollandica Lb]
MMSRFVTSYKFRAYLVEWPKNYIICFFLFFAVLPINTILWNMFTYSVILKTKKKIRGLSFKISCDSTTHNLISYTL